MSLLMKFYPGSVRTAAFSGQSWMLLLLLSLISLGSLEAQDSESFGKPTLKPWLATVDGSSVNLRTGPSTNHHAFTRLTKEVSVIAMGGSGDWVEIVIPSDIPIWIHGDFVESMDSDKLQVRGKSVRLRAQSNTKYTPLGMTEQGQVLRSTGKRSDDGKWVQIFAPLNARGWIHGDYIRRSDQEINALRLSALHDKLKSKGNPVVIAPVIEKDTSAKESVSEEKTSGSETAGIINEDPNAIKIPSFESPRLKELFESFRVETEKPPVGWDFSAICRKIEVFETTSEDLGEIRVVKDLARTINEHFVPLQRRLVEIERQQELARVEREKAQTRDKEILRRTGHRNSPTDQKYQAVGWVVPLGKHRKVEASHKLMKGSQLLYYLDGEKLNLDQYVNKRVGIVGTIEEQDPSTGARLLVIQKIEILSR